MSESDMEKFNRLFDEMFAHNDKQILRAEALRRKLDEEFPVVKEHFNGQYA